MKVLVNWRRRKAEFQYPIEPVPRTAVLDPWFTSKGFKLGSRTQVRIFGRDQLEDELERFGPQAVAASCGQLKRCRTKIAPTHAVIVLHRASRFAPLRAADREWLWREFRVPVFEQVIGPRGELLATECEAHDGMHIVSPSMRLSGYVDAAPCACGLKTPRLLPGEPGERLRAVAAYAR